MATLSSALLVVRDEFLLHPRAPSPSRLALSGQQNEIQEERAAKDQHEKREEQSSPKSPRRGGGGGG